MVGELLELSRVGERELPGERVGLADAVLRAAVRWAPTAEGRGQRIDAVAAQDGAAAWIARADLDRAIDVLVENALHYSGEGSTVTLEARPDGIEVLDQGPGLAESEHEAVFDRFHRGAAGRAGPGGSGLGLPIARELVRRWGGDVRLGNRPAGNGARARVTVPPPPRDFTGS
jgi:two-component system sensor histidine kinase TctE